MEEVEAGREGGKWEEGSGVIVERGGEGEDRWRRRPPLSLLLFSSSSSEVGCDVGMVIPPPPPVPVVLFQLPYSSSHYSKTEGESCCPTFPRV